MMKIEMLFQGNLGYGPDQVQGLTLADLLEQVQDAVTEWGEDAEVVLCQTNNVHGANYGKLYHGYELFQAVEADDEAADEAYL